MPDRRVRVLHVDADVVTHYDSDDLNLFQSIVEDVMQELREMRSPLATTANEAETRTRLAVAIFKCAGSGERVRERLTRQALRALAEIDDDNGTIH